MNVIWNLVFFLSFQEHAFESSQKYKEGKFIIELAHMIKDNGWDWPRAIANHPPYSVMWCAFVMWLTCDRHVTSSSIGHFSHLSVSQSGLLCVDHCVPCVTVLLDSTVLAVFVPALIWEVISILGLNRQKGTFTHDLRLNNVSTIFEMWLCWHHYYHVLFVRDHPVWIILLPW